MSDWYSFVRRPEDGSFILLSPDRSEEHVRTSRYLGRTLPAIFLYAKGAAYELVSGGLWDMSFLGQHFYRKLTDEEARQLLSRDDFESVLAEILLDSGLQRIMIYRSLMSPEASEPIQQAILAAHDRKAEDLRQAERKQQDDEAIRDRRRLDIKVDEVPKESLGAYVGTLAEQQQARVAARSRKGWLRERYDKVRAFLRG